MPYQHFLETFVGIDILGPLIHFFFVPTLMISLEPFEKLFVLSLFVNFGWVFFLFGHSFREVRELFILEFSQALIMREK